MSTVFKKMQFNNHEKIYVVNAPQDFAYGLIGKLVKKVSVKKWIAQYEKELKKSK